MFIPEVLTALSEQRPVFHSEADFQHALAWEVHRRLPQASVRLERPVKLSSVDKPLHVDVWIECGGDVLVTELKYKTRALQTLESGERFTLQNRGAQDLGRYDFIKDVWRVEAVVVRSAHATGYAILLTKDPSYWARSHNDRTVDADFRLHEGGISAELLAGQHTRRKGPNADGRNDSSLPVHILCGSKTTLGQASKPNARSSAT